MIRVDAMWLTLEPLDLRAGTEAALVKVVAVFGSARPHQSLAASCMASTR